MCVNILSKLDSSSHEHVRRERDNKQTFFFSFLDCLASNVLKEKALFSSSYQMFRFPTGCSRNDIFSRTREKCLKESDKIILIWNSFSTRPGQAEIHVYVVCARYTRHTPKSLFLISAWNGHATYISGVAHVIKICDVYRAQASIVAKHLPFACLLS